MNLPDKIETWNEADILVNLDYVAGAINQLIDYLVEKEAITQSTDSDVQTKSIQQESYKRGYIQACID